ncbi:MAG TPA: HD domain-containing phosphohydrolase [Pyrinomonadaceae bacterium]|jgi:HD-GYP domain-containing protein (c-di-GMP phosphodiesterase class II)
MSDQTTKLIHAFSALADLGEELADTRDFEEMVRTTLHVVLGTLGVRRGAVAEYMQGDGALRFVAAWGLGDEPPTTMPFAAASAEMLSIPQPRALSLSDTEQLELTRHHLGEQLFKTLVQYRLQLTVPLVVHKKFVGFILLGDKATGEEFTPDEKEVVRTMARHIGVGIYNHRLLREVEQRAEESRGLYEDLRTIYRDTVRAFAAAIDCKDKYTQGHSERVGKYSEIIAREMGWSEEQVEGIAVAGYLHDIGKLVVERDIINAPYKIDAKQSSELNRHPAAGYEILAPIQHPYADIPLMAKYHHERIDGRGYPEGLTGDQIPAGAKIVAVADSFDAMTTDRTYKRRKVFTEVIEDFRKNAGKQFAPDVLAALCRAMLKEVNGETKERLMMKLLGKGYLEPEECRPLLVELIAELESSASLAATTSVA